MNIITENSVTIFENFKPITVNSNHKRFDEIVQLVNGGYEQDALFLIDNKRAASKAINTSEFELVGDCLYLYDYRIPDNMAQRIFALMAD